MIFQQLKKDFLDKLNAFIFCYHKKYFTPNCSQALYHAYTRVYHMTSRLGVK